MKASRKISATLALLTMVGATPALAGQCEDSFDRQAKILGHMRFSAQVELPGLSVTSAFGQLRTILPNYGIRIVHEDPAVGQMNAQTTESMAASGQPVDIYYSDAAGRGLVQISYAAKTNLLRGKGRFREQLCGILNQLSARGANPAAMRDGAQPVRVVTGAISVDAVQLSQQVLATTGNPARLHALFEGHEYAVTGKILGIREYKKRRYVVTFQGERINLLCKTAKKQDRTVALFEVGRRETMVGTFKSYNGGNDGDGPAIIIEDCRAP
ncbi:MAG: hypothetical protein RL367_257 [Pseudomonadota bacterium]